jgi:GT2 family glycosyltransferase
MKTAILIPTFYRSKGLNRALSSLRKNTLEFDIDIFVIAEKDDIESILISNQWDAMFTTCDKKEQGPGYAWNVGLKFAENIYQYNYYFLGSDDMSFEANWLEEALQIMIEKLPGGGVVGINEQQGKFQRAGFCPYYLMSRDYIRDHNGGIAAYPYPADFTDIETCIRAKRINKFAYAPNSKVNHHWRETMDKGYKKAISKQSEAKKMYEKRYKDNFPDDIERIIF